jgi:hypothetical protein
MTNKFSPTIMSDQGSVLQPRDPNTLNNDNKAKTTQPTIQAPNLQVYKPDYSALENSFNQILQSYQGFREATQAQHDAQKASLDTSLEQSVRNIGQAKEKTTEQFGKARNQLSTDLFEVGRNTQAQMSARGLAGSGIEAMANIQNRMAAGESLSGMANEFFDAQTQLVQAEEDTRANYNNNLQALGASLQGAMAQIMSQEASSRMDYTQMVEGLKRQVIMDTNSVNESMAQWREAQRQLEEGSQITNTMIQQVLANSSLTDADKMATLKDFGYSDSEAQVMVLRDKDASKQTLFTNVQKIIGNIWANPYASDAEKKQSVASVINELALSGADIDINRLDTDKPSTKKTTTATTPKTSAGSNFESGSLPGSPNEKFVLPFLGQSGTSTPLMPNIPNPKK